MAKYREGIMGAFNGTIGPVVGYEWKGRSCMRSRGIEKNPRTESQQKGRAMFGTASRLWSRMRSAAEIGLRGVANEAKVTETNIFVQINRHCINIENGVVKIDYPQLQIAQGALAGVDFEEPCLVEGMKVVVDFNTNPTLSGSNGDYVYLFAYNPTQAEGHLSLPVKRHNRHIESRLPAHWSSQEVHLYGFVWDHDRNASPSSYLGSVTLT